jgi:hypothetical protein
MEIKKCARCKEIKPIDNFRIINKKNGCRYSYCKECTREYHRTHCITNIINIKKCSKCGEVLPIEKFNFRNEKTGYRQNYCRICQRIKNKEYRLNNLQKERNRDKEYRENNKTQISKNYKKYYETHKDYYRNRMLIKFRENLQYRLGNNISRGMRQALNNLKGHYHWEKLVNYKAKDLKQHLENQFKDNMSWDNYGKKGWHIDHIIPISWWKYKSPEDREFKQCWALANLQPLWAEDNYKKNNLFV